MATLTINPALTSQQNAQKAVAEPKKKADFFDVSARFVSEKYRTAAKVVSLSSEWAKMGEINNPTWDTVGNHAEFIKLGTAPFELAGKLNETRHKVVEFARDPSLKTGAKAFLSANGCVGPVWDMADFARKFCGVSKDAVKPFLGATGISTMIGSGYGIGEAVVDIADSGLAEAKTEEKKAEAKFTISKAVINLARNVSLFALGVLIVLSIFFGIVASPIFFLTFSTLGTVLSILSFYHDNLFKPENKV